MSLLLIGHSYPQTSSGSPAMGFNPGLRESPREHVTVMMPRPTPQRLSFDWAGVGPRHLHARVRKLAWRGDFLNVRSGFHNRVPTKFSFLSLHTLTPARPAPVPVPACSATPSGACSLHPNPAEPCAPWGNLSVPLLLSARPNAMPWKVSSLLVERAAPLHIPECSFFPERLHPLPSAAWVAFLGPVPSLGEGKGWGLQAAYIPFDF